MECSAERIELVTEQIMQVLQTQVRAWVSTVAEAEAGTVLEVAEEAVHSGMQAVGQAALGALLAGFERGYQSPAPSCAQCPSRLRLVRYQPKQLRTLLGELTLERAYYRCARCGYSMVPLDGQLGLGTHSLSRGLQQAICQLGVHLPFAPCAQVLAQLLHLDVDDNMVQRVVTAVGQTLSQAQAQQVAQVWHDATPPACEGPAPQRLYLSVDGTTVHLEEGWKEVKVAALYETVATYSPAHGTRQRAVNLSYVVSFEPAAQFAQLVYLEAARRGLHLAEEVVIVGDGASWIWNHIPAFCDSPVEILDYYHARHYLWQAAHARYGEHSPRAQAWVDDLCTLLFEQGVEPFLHRLWQSVHETWDEVRTVMQNTLAYFTTHRQRIDYAALRQADFHIGSGSVESACKRVIGARLKQAGMRWSRRGAEAVATLRATVLSQRWDSFWHSDPPPLSRAA